MNQTDFVVEAPRSGQPAPRGSPWAPKVLSSPAPATARPCCEGVQVGWEHSWAPEQSSLAVLVVLAAEPSREARLARQIHHLQRQVAMAARSRFQRASRPAAPWEARALERLALPLPQQVPKSLVGLFEDLSWDSPIRMSRHRTQRLQRTPRQTRLAQEARPQDPQKRQSERAPHPPFASSVQPSFASPSGLQHRHAHWSLSRSRLTRFRTTRGSSLQGRAVRSLAAL